MWFMCAVPLLSHRRRPVSSLDQHLSFYDAFPKALHESVYSSLKYDDQTTAGDGWVCSLARKTIDSDV